MSDSCKNCIHYHPDSGREGYCEMLRKEVYANDYCTEYEDEHKR
ncbi:hypothetical protein [Bacillus toyonensis]|nr:hypothetical protein [Bacillus toyonensis]